MKKTKRSIILSLVLIAAIVLPFLGMFAWAEFNGTLSVDAPSSAVPGETVRVTVSIPRGTDAINGSFNLVYDHTMLEVVSCTAGTILKDYNVNVNSAYATDKIRLTFQGEEPLSDGGTALTAVFRVLPSASGIAHFECEKFKLFDADYNPISTTDSASADTYIVNDAETVISIAAPTTAQSGDTVEVLVNVEDPQNIYGGSFNLIYDPAAFTVKSASGGSLLSSFTKQINKNYAENKVRFIWAGSSAVSGNGTLAKVTFTVNDGVQGECDFSLERIKIADANGTVLECAAENAQTNLTCTHAHMAWTVTTPATCTETGVEAYMCGCGETEGTREIPATGHQSFDWITVTEPTCTEGGMEEYACLKCGYVQQSREIAATGHAHMEWVTTVDETCDNEGTREYKCADCGYVETTETVAAHGHIYEDIVTPPTKTEDGYTTHTCKDCGISYTDSVVPALGFDITYNANGGSGAPSAQNKKAGEEIALSDTVPTREGYAFWGWATDETATKAEYYGGNEYAEDADLTLYAVWEANKHTVTYVVDGAVYTIKTYDYNALVEAEAEPQKEGHTFSGWSDIPIRMPNEDVEVTGSFAINTYTLTFDANGGENAPAAIEATYGTEITLPAVMPTRENANFVGWGKTANAHKADYTATGNLTLTGDTTLYAVWTEIWDGTSENITLAGRGTRANPYRISNASELAFMAAKVDEGDEAYNAAYYIQTADIALNDTSNVANWDTQAPANEWEPIGDSDHPFMGTYDGNGYSIAGIYINKNGDATTDNNQGLFGFVTEGSISNVDLVSGYIKANNATGGLIGGSFGITVKKCSVNVMLKGSDCTGAIIGALESRNCVSTIQDCLNYGDVYSANRVAGIVGSCESFEYAATIDNCKNFGNISGNTKVGGIGGNASANGNSISFQNCSNEGDIISQEYQSGGIVGHINAGSQNLSVILNCNNKGNINGVSTLGGIAGGAKVTKIENCYNIGGVTSNNGCDFGGIVGFAGNGSTVLDCYSLGMIQGSGTSGGIVGAMYNQSGISGNNRIENCFSGMRIINSGDNVGGICGYLLENSTIAKCINVGNITANNATNKGGIAGYSSGTVEQSYYLSTCGAAGPGRALSYPQMQSAANYAHYAGSTESWDTHWSMGANPYATYPMIKGLDNFMENPIEFDLNGGTFDEYEFCASVFASVINQESGTDYLTIYNNSGTLTRTADYGCEVLVDSRNMVTDIIEYQGNNTVPNGGFILYGNHIMHEWIVNNIEVGDKVYYGLGDNTNNYYKVKVYKKNPRFTYATGFITYLPTPHKDGYVFSGWADDNGTIISWNTDMNYIGKITLHATWTQPTEIARSTYGGNTYILFNEATSWESAQAYCESVGGHLATITSAEENAAVVTLLQNGNRAQYLIGATDTKTEGAFRWVTGEALSYTNWYTGEPSNSGVGEDAMTIFRRDGKWNDHRHAYIPDVGFICEIENLTPSNATIYQGHYYQAFDKNFSWAQAKTYCESQGGHLVTITSAGENDAVQALIENQANKLYWLGGTDAEEEGAWRWITGEEWEYTNWNANQPDNSGGHENWLQIFTKKESAADNGFWNDSRDPVIDSYGASIGFVCEYDSIEPAESVEYNGHRYELYDLSLSWTQAKEYCDSVGGYLVTITSAEENEAIVGLMHDTPYCYIGATDSEAEGAWRWITGEAWNYSNWISGEPNNSGNNEHFGEIYLEINLESGKWNDNQDKYYASRSFICEYGNTEEYTPVGAFLHNGHYYEIYDNVLSWQYAQAYCESQGGHLATVTSEGENEALVGAIEQYGDLNTVEKYWLGGNDTWEEGSFQWITGEEWAYTNWNTGEPNNDGNEDYAVILSRTSTLGKWNDSPSQRSMTGFICEYDAYNIEPVVTTSYNTHTYQVFDNVLSWQDAKEYCESLGGHLVTITSEAEQNALLTAINENNAESSITHYWLGAYNENSTQTMRWITGEAFEYSNLQDYQNDINCWLDLKATSGKWWAYGNFYPHMGFICEFEPENEIKVGDYIQMGSYYDDPILWRCVSIDENGPLILSDKALCLKPFDAATSMNEETGSHSRSSQRRVYGSNDWSDSNLRAWLNSSEADGSVSWSCGNPPSEEYVYEGLNDYDGEAGFLSGFDENELNLIKRVTQKAIVGVPEANAEIYSRGSEIFITNTSITSIADVLQNYDNAYCIDVSDKMFCLDVKQLYALYQNSSILGDDYYLAKPTDKAVNNSEYKNDLLEANNYCYYWLRTPDCSGLAWEVKCITDQGRPDRFYASMGRVGVRPAFYLNTSTNDSFDGSGTAAEPFTVKEPTVSSIEIGEYVQMGTYYGEPILWRCVDIDENGPLMLSDKILCLKAFDASGDNTTGSHGRGYDSGSYRREYGSNYWGDSNIRDWLNSDASAGNVVWSCGNVPDSQHLDYNAYADEAGFLTNFADPEKAAMKPVTHKMLLEDNEYANMSEYGATYHNYNGNISYVVQNYDVAFSEEITDTVFLPDVKQIYAVYTNSDILGENYYLGYPTGEAVTNSDYTASNISPSSPINYWLSSPSPHSRPSSYVVFNDRNYVRSVLYNGTVYFANANSGYYGVRPAFYLNDTTSGLFDGVGTEESPYFIEDATQPEPVINYELYLDGVLSQSVPSGAIVTLAEPTERENLTFLGWATSENATETEYVAGDTITVTADVNLYSVWQENETEAQVKIGDYIQMGSYYNDPILWRCISFEKISGYDENENPIIDSTDTSNEYQEGYLPLFISEDILCLKAFDAAGSNTDGSHSRGRYNGAGRGREGSNYWGDSNLRKWLNSDATADNIIWPCGNLPIQNMMWNRYNPYDAESGFLTSFTSDEINSVMSVKQKFFIDAYEYSANGQTASSTAIANVKSVGSVPYNYATADAEWSVDGFFVPDIQQVKNMCDNLGVAYCYAKPTVACYNNTDFRDDKFSSSKVWNYWTRTPNASNSESLSSTHLRIVNGTISGYGNAGGYGANQGVRPSFFFDPETVVEGNGTLANPYTIVSSNPKELRYSVKYEANGGTDLSKKIDEIGGHQNADLSVTSIKQGCTLMGWTDNIESSEPLNECVITKDTVLYAIWVANEDVVYTVYYDNNGGESVSSESKEFHLNTQADLSVTASREGYSFLGWNTEEDANEALTDYLVTSDVTLYAIWVKDEGGLIGNNTWAIKNGKLIVSGDGVIPDFTTPADAPWYPFRNSITSIEIADGVTSIGSNAFAKLNQVTSIEIADTVARIGDYAFHFCTSLKDISINKNVELGNSVFANSGVDSVTIESGIKKLPTNAFANCEDIANVSIPVSVTDTNNAFSGTHIEKITYSGTRTQFERIMEGLSFDEVECLAEGETYTADDFIDHTVPVESITLENRHMGLEIGDTATIIATVLPENATDQTLAWASSNDLAVTVDQNGTVTAVAVGVSEISATSADGKVKAICTVYVSKAANLTEATLYASNVTAKNSETFEMAVSLQNNPGIASMRVKVDYNDAVMQLIDVEDMGLLGDAFHSTDYDTTPYTLYWDNGIASENFTANGDIAKLTFKVYDNVEAGEYPITVTCDYDNADAIDCNLEVVQIETVEGNVSIESFLYGDVDDNEKVNALDSAILSRFIAKWQGVTVNLDAADVNKDTKVNALDSAILKRHVANWAEYRSLPYVMNGISLFAVDSNQPEESGTLSVSSAEGRVGDTVDVYVSLDDNPGIVTMRLDVDYDQEALELIGVEDLGILPGEVHSLEYGLYPYVLYWDNGAAQSDFTQTGKLVRLTFLVKENAKTGDHVVSVSYDANNYDIFNKDLKEVPFEAVTGSVRILEAAPNEPTITVSETQVGQKLTCKVDLASPDAITGKVVVSVYGNNNKLLECKRFDAVEHIDVEMNTTNGAKMKVMWWEDIISMIPIAESVETNLN